MADLSVMLEARTEKSVILASSPVTAKLDRLKAEEHGQPVSVLSMLC